MRAGNHLSLPHNSTEGFNAPLIDSAQGNYSDVEEAITGGYKMYAEVWRTSTLKFKTNVLHGVKSIFIITTLNNVNMTVPIIQIDGS